VIRLLPGGTGFIYLAADRAATNVAILRTSLGKHLAALE
jgi:hypothetical protein